jgi:hypothetical protein
VDVLALVLIIALLGVVVAIVAAPLRRGRATEAEGRDRGRIAALQAAKEAKYREIRELELDYRTGKLSEADFRAQDRDRRAEAVEVLRELDKLGAGDGAADGPDGLPS